MLIWVAKLIKYGTEQTNWGRSPESARVHVTQTVVKSRNNTKTASTQNEFICFLAGPQIWHSGSQDYECTKLGGIFKAELIWSLVRFNQGRSHLLSWLRGPPLNMEHSLGTLLIRYPSLKSAERLGGLQKIHWHTEDVISTSSLPEDFDKAPWLTHRSQASTDSCIWSWTV